LTTFESSLIVTASDLDALEHVNNVRYVQWVQDIAEAHWLQTASKPILDSYFWVLLSHQIDYKRPALLGDTVLLRTYVRKSEGVTSTRHVDIYNADTEKLLVTSVTKWCFLSKKTMRPARIPAEVIAQFED
jgi:acyl-CoA thioester hydrolase